MPSGNTRRKRTALQERNNLRAGWKIAPGDLQTQRRRNQRFRLRVAKYQPDDNVDYLVAKFLKKGGKVTQLPPGYALGAHRDGVEILTQ